MFKVSGISGKISDFDEEDTAEVTNVESSRKALVDVLGVEKRDRLLASLYLVRQDGVSVVRQSSIQIWKALVHNTPRTGKYWTNVKEYNLTFKSSSGDSS